MRNALAAIKERGQRKIPSGLAVLLILCVAAIAVCMVLIHWRNYPLERAGLSPKTKAASLFRYNQPTADNFAGLCAFLLKHPILLESL